MTSLATCQLRGAWSQPHELVCAGILSSVEHRTSPARLMLI
jgi:hypothetical protein